MQENKFLKWLPGIFILIGIGLWVNSLCFSPITNGYEKDLVEDWKVNLEEGISIVNRSNKKLHFDIKLAVMSRPDDEIILNSSTQILALKEKSFQLLDEHLERSDTSIFNIMTTFQKGIKEILYNAMKKNRMIREEEIEMVLIQEPFYRVNWSDDIGLLIITQKQSINSITTMILNYLANKIGSVCSFPFTSFTIDFRRNVLKKGELVKGKIYSSESSRYKEIISNTKYTINGKHIETRDAARLKKTFTNTSPQKIEVECKYERAYFDNQNIVKDSVFLKRDFIIYPIQG